MQNLPLILSCFIVPILFVVFEIVIFSKTRFTVVSEAEANMPTFTTVIFILFIPVFLSLIWGMVKHHRRISKAHQSYLSPFSKTTKPTRLFTLLSIILLIPSILGVCLQGWISLDDNYKLHGILADIGFSAMFLSILMWSRTTSNTTFFKLHMVRSMLIIFATSGFLIMTKNESIGQQVLLSSCIACLTTLVVESNYGASMYKL